MYKVTLLRSSRGLAGKKVLRRPEPEGSWCPRKAAAAKAGLRCVAITDTFGVRVDSGFLSRGLSIIDT